jgi:hypothetical protein
MNCNDEMRRYAGGVAKAAAPHGLELECLCAYYAYLSLEYEPAGAAQCALWDWDIAEEETP